MEAERWADVRQVVEEALDVSVDERSRFVARRCGDDPELERQVRELLRFHDLSGDAGEWTLRDRDQPLPDDPPERVGKYVVVEEVARGGMGAILRVRDPRLRRHLALKVLLSRPHLDGGEATHQDALARFLGEASITGRLEHPGIVPVHDVGLTDDGRAYFTMRLVGGRDLRRVLDDARDGVDGWSTTRVLNVLLRACETVAFAHSKGIVHRDLKPANIMVGAFGEVCVMDWGVAKILDDEERHDLRVDLSSDDGAPDLDAPLVTMNGDVLGTPVYMPPEQARGETERIGPRADVYALGAILYELLTGCMPYVPPEGGVTPRDVLRLLAAGPPEPVERRAPDAPAELAAVCAKAMAHDLEQRYSDVLEMADDLRAYLENRVVRAYRTDPVAALKKWVARNRGLTAGVAAAVLAIVVAVVSGFLVQSDALATKSQSLRRVMGQYLSVESTRALDQNPGLSLALAVEARRFDDTVHVRGALLEAVERCRERRTVPAHGAPIRSLDVTGDGALILTTSADGSAATWDTDGRQVARYRHHDSVVAGAFDATGRLVVTASFDGTAAIWEARTGAEVRRLIGSDGWVRDARFDPSGARVVTASEDGTARIWDVASGRETAGLRGHTARVREASFAPDGTSVLTASDDGTARIWSSTDGEPRAVLGPGAAGLSSARFSPDGRWILTVASELPADVDASGAREVTLWDAETGARSRRLATSDALCAAFDPSGRLVATGSQDGAVRVFRAEDGGEVIAFPGAGSSARHVAFGPRGARLAIAHDDGHVRVRTLSTARGPLLLGHEAAARAVTWIPGTTRIATISDDATLRVWRSDESPWIEATAQPPVARFTLSSDGARFLTVEESGLIGRLWHAEDGRAAGEISFATPIVDADLGSNGRLLVVGRDGAARVVDTTVGMTTFAIDEAARVTSGRLVEDGDAVVVVSAERRCFETWSLADERRLTTTALPAVRVRIDPHGRTLIAGPDDAGELSVFDVRTGLRRATIPSGREVNIEFSPDGETLLIHALTSPDVRLFDVSTGAPTWVLAGDRARLSMARFVADGALVMTVATDGRVVLFDHETGRATRMMESGASGFATAALARDGDRVFVRTGDEAVLWDTTTAARITAFGSGAAPAPGVRVRPDGEVFLLTPNDAGPAMIVDAATGAVLEELPLGPRPRHVEFSRDSRWLYAVTSSGTFHAWPADISEVAIRRAPRLLSESERRRYRWDESTE